MENDIIESAEKSEALAYALGLVAEKLITIGGKIDQYFWEIYYAMYDEITALNEKLR